MNPEGKTAPSASQSASVGAGTVRQRQTIRGVVVSDKMMKSRVIEIKRAKRHGLYHKSVLKNRRLMVHDEKNESRVGDVILAVSTRPLSKNKCFRVEKVVTKRVVE